MRRLMSLLMLPLLAACATDQPPRPTVIAARADACAAIQAGGLVDPREPGALGCANAVNLRLMIDNPNDLERGVDQTEVSDELAMAAAQRRRLGKTPRLGAEQSAETYGSSSSSQAQ